MKEAAACFRSGTGHHTARERLTWIPNARISDP
jgi:hypothetical protein